MSEGDGHDQASEFFGQVAAQYPEVFAAYEALGTAAASAGPLDERTVRLVKLALAAGLTTAELEHAILLGMTTLGLPRTMAALAWVRDVTER